MKKVFQIIKWQCSYLEYAPKHELSLFNHYLTIGTHFPRTWSWGVEVHYERGINGLNYFYQYWQFGEHLEPILKDPGRATSIVIRFGRPIITIYLSRKTRDRGYESTMRHKVN